MSTDETFHSSRKRDFDSFSEHESAEIGPSAQSSLKQSSPQIERLAGDCGQWISEWVRHVLLDAVRESEPLRQKATFAELQAIRLLLINTLEPLLRGEKMTSEQFKELLRYVKNNKRKAAEEMLASYAIGATEE